MTIPGFVPIAEVRTYARRCFDEVVERGKKLLARVRKTTRELSPPGPPVDASRTDSHRLLDTVKRHKRMYLTLNLCLYGTVAIAMVAGSAFPRLHANVLAQTNKELASVQVVTDAYANGDVFLAAALTFLVNLGFGSFATITAPSTVVPFFGVAFTVWRFVQWGLLFTPAAANASSLLPHYLTLLIEGQAYVLAAFAVTLHGRMFLQPERFGHISRMAGYKAGLVTTSRAYPTIALLLLVAAIYEAVEVIYFVND